MIRRIYIFFTSLVIFSATFIPVLVGQNLTCQKLEGFPNYENGEYNQINPTISPDGKRMIFIKAIKEGKDFKKYYYESIFDGSWNESQPLDLINSAKGSMDDGSRVSFSPDGTRIYFHARFQGSKGRDIYYSEYIDGLWQPPRSVGVPINSEHEEFGVWVDENYTIYFTRSINKDKEEPEVKIYYSRMDVNGSWTQPEVWFQELGFHHTEYPVVFRENAIIFYATNKGEDQHQYYLSVRSGDQWSIPILIKFDCSSRSIVSTTSQFSYLYFDDGGNLLQAEVPESLRNMVNSTKSEPAIIEGVKTVVPPDFNTNDTDRSTLPKSGNSGSRLALIIGNSSYLNAPLQNPVNDAEMMAIELESAGFEVLKYTNIGRIEMREAIRKFGDKINQNNGIGLFYYAGHGIQSSGINYLVPVDADIQREYDIEDQCIQADHVLRMMESYQNPMNIIILDACRNNPYTTSFRTVQRGLAQPESAPTGSIVAFATAPGKTAADGDGNNGLYTQELIKAIRIPGLTIEEVFKEVRINVLELSGGDQVPWQSSSLTGDFYFYPDDRK